MEKKKIDAREKRYICLDYLVGFREDTSKKVLMCTKGR